MSRWVGGGGGGKGGGGGRGGCRPGGGGAGGRGGGGVRGRRPDLWLGNDNMRKKLWQAKI